MFSREARFQRIVQDINTARRTQRIASPEGRQAELQVARRALNLRGRVPQWLLNKAEQHNRAHFSTIHEILAQAERQKDRSRRGRKFNELVTAVQTEPLPEFGGREQTPGTTTARRLLNRNGEMPRWLKSRIKRTDLSLRQDLVTAISNAQSAHRAEKLSEQFGLPPQRRVSTPVRR
jgi:hypothetical protein